MSVRALLRLVRWPGAVTAAVDAATAFVVAHAATKTSRGEALAACAVAFAGAVVYSGGVVLNDVADAERDKTLHPARPIPSGAVAPSSARTFGLTLLLVGAALSTAVAGPWAGAASAAAALFALVYDFAAKRFRILGGATLGLARAANVLAGALAAVSTPSALLADAPLALVFALAVFGYTALLTFASTFEERAPTKFAAGAFAIALLVVAALPWATFLATWRGGPALAYGPLAAVLIVAAREAAETPGPGMGALIRAGVFGFLLVDAAWLFGVGRYDRAFEVILGYVVLRLALHRARS